MKVNTSSKTCTFRVKFAESLLNPLSAPLVVQSIRRRNSHESVKNTAACAWDLRNEVIAWRTKPEQNCPRRVSPSMNEGEEEERHYFIKPQRRFLRERGRERLPKRNYAKNIGTSTLCTSSKMNRQRGHLFIRGWARLRPKTKRWSIIDCLKSWNRGETLARERKTFINWKSIAPPRNPTPRRRRARTVRYRPCHPPSQ